ncbi:MAG: hypothetical protein ACRDN0_16700 [Trebonia sp.]
MGSAAWSRSHWTARLIWVILLSPRPSWRTVSPRGPVISRHRISRRVPMIAYGQSKTANVLLAVEAGRRWAGDGITANAVHPGAILETGLSRHMPARLLGNVRATTKQEFKTIGQGAATSVVVATAPALSGVTGRYFEDCQESETIPPGTPDIPGHARGVAWYALYPGYAEELWEVSEKPTAVGS